MFCIIFAIYLPLRKDIIINFAPTVAYVEKSIIQKKIYLVMN